MNRVPRIAVLLAAYQGIKWIEEQVESILTQESVQVSLFISVDACPDSVQEDGTLAWCQRLSNYHDNVIVLPFGERFGGAGPNFFRLLDDIDFSGYDAVAFADQDDIWLCDKLKRAWDKIRSGECLAYSSNVTAFWPDGRELLVRKSYPQRRYDHYFEAAGPGCTYVLHQSVAERLQHFVQTNKRLIRQIEIHDWFTYAFCREQGIPWYIDEQPSLMYRQHSSNQIGVNQGVRAYFGRLHKVAKKSYRKQVEMLTEILEPDLSTKVRSYRFRLRHALQFRRRLRDRFALLIMFLLSIY